MLRKQLRQNEDGLLNKTTNYDLAETTVAVNFESFHEQAVGAKLKLAIRLHAFSLIQGVPKETMQ